MKSVLFAGQDGPALRNGYGAKAGDQAFMIGPCDLAAGKRQRSAVDMMA
jgi:hypothetical protein